MTNKDRDIQEKNKKKMCNQAYEYTDRMTGKSKSAI